MSKRSLVQTIFQYTFYLSVLSFVLFLLLVFLHFTITPIFSFGDDDSQGIFGIPTTTREQTCYTVTAAVPDVSCNFVSLEPYGYTLSFDIELIGDFGSTTIPRILLYRATQPLTLATTESRIEAVQASKLANSNCTVYIDPLKNDLRVYTVHEGGATLDTLLIENVPLRAPFRLTMVFTDTFLELYKNGDLVKSFPFAKKPIETPPGSYVFGPPNLVNGLIKVANISYWNYPLTSRSVRVHGKKTIPTGPFENKRAA